MQPAAVLAVVVKTQGVASSNAQLQTVDSTLRRTEASGKAAAASMVTAGKKVQSAGASMAAVGTKLNRKVTLPLLAIGAASIKMYKDFEESNTKMVSLVGISRKQVKAWEEDMFRISKATARAPAELADAMFFITSAGLRGETALETLEVSAKAAAAGLGETKVVADAATSAMNAYGPEVLSASKAVDLLTGAVREGKLESSELAPNIGKVIPIASAMGVQFDEVAAAFAAMSRTGTDASKASTQVKAILSSMLKPASQVEDYLKKIGLSAGDVRKSLREDGFLATLQMLYDRVEGNKAALGKLFPNVRAISGVMDLLGSNASDNVAIFHKLAKEAGSADRAFKAWGQSEGAQVDKTLNTVRIEAVKLGKTLLPILVPGLLAVVGAFTDVAGAISHLPPGFQKTIGIAIGLAAALGPLLWLVGNVTKTVGLLMVTGGKLTTWLGINTVATQAATVANAEYAASLQAAAVAQSELLIANRSGVVTGSIPVGTGATSTVAQTGAKSGAATFAAGFARFLPVALAAVGLGNILQSAVTGDTEGALKKAGGAAGGALIGGMIGSVVPGIGTVTGALAGAGIGSIVGGILGDSGDSVSEFERRVQESTRKVEQSMEGQKLAFRTAGEAQKQLSRIGDRQTRVSRRIERTEQQLADARKNHKAGAPEVERAERKLARLKNREIRLTRRQWSQEQLLGGARNRGKQHLRNLREAEVGLVRAKQLGVEQTRKEVQEARRILENHTRQGKSLKTLTEDEERLRRKKKEARGATKALVEWEKRLATTMKEISDRFGPKYADHLRRVIPLWGSTKEQVRATEKFMRRLVPGLVPISVQMRNFGKEGKQKTKDVKVGFEKVKGALGPFRSESSTQLGKAKKDMQSWRKASTTGVTTVEEKLGSFAGQLGFKAVQFGVKQGKGQKKQKGGMVVPGAGTGDKVRMTADVEPGEVIHVLNMRAAKDRETLGKLELANREVPRFQLGGTFVDPAGPGTGVVNRAIADVVGKWSTKYNAAINYGYDPGGGHVSPGHNVTGTATDTGPAAGWESGTKLFESGLRAISGKVDQILYGSHGIGTPYKNHGWGNHAHIEWGMHPDVQGVLGALIKKLEMTGPDGQLKEIGQATLDSAVKMANRKLQQLGGVGGGPDIGDFSGPGKVVGASTYRPDAYTGTVGAAGKSLIGKMAFAELGMGQNLGGLPFGAKLKITRGGRSVVGEKLDIGAGGGPVQGHRRDIDLWYETANAIGLPDDWLGLVEIQKAQRGGTLGEYLGALKKGSKGKGSPFKGPLSAVAGEHYRKGKAMVRQLNRKLEGMGFAPDSPVIRRLAELTTDVEKYDEFAVNASALTKVDEEGNITQGLFKGQAEPDWLNQKLGALMSLRKQLITAHGIVDKKVAKVVKLLHEAKKRLIKVRRAIRKGEEAKRKIERRIKSLERDGDKKVRDIEQEKKELERQLDKAKGAKNPDRARIDHLREEIKNKNQAIRTTGDESREAIKKQRGHLRRVNKTQASRRRVEDSLANTLIPTLEGKRSDLLQTGVDLYGSGGSLGAFNYMGLQTVQGTGSTLDEVPNPPPIGSLGGEVFNVQNRLKEIGEEAERTKVESPISDTAEQLAELNAQLATEWKQRYAVSQAQFKTLQNYPSVQQVAMPYAGAFALGGSVVAKVGERGAEYAVMPTGSYMVNNREAKEAIAAGGGRGSGSGSAFVIEELNVYSDGVEVKTADDVETIVKKVNRREGRGPHTPGGRR